MNETRTGELFQPAAFGVGEAEAEIVGGATTVKFTPLLVAPFAVTTTFPVVAPTGTLAIMLVAPQLVGVAVTPLNFTVPEPWLAPKFAPIMLTLVPTEALPGEIVEIAGAASTKK
ncbi:MAG: hypothetical protein JSR72_23545 [Proteobacteria bacterium]|nr:hypothetical protein [Pseudomonadota bacterium]